MAVTLGTFTHRDDGSFTGVLRTLNVNKAIVMDNVLFINRKEEALKRVMSRLEVRITTDQEAGEAVL